MIEHTPEVNAKTLLRNHQPSQRGRDVEVRLFGFRVHPAYPLFDRRRPLHFPAQVVEALLLHDGPPAAIMVELGPIQAAADLHSRSQSRKGLRPPPRRIPLRPLRTAHCPAGRRRPAGPEGAKDANGVISSFDPAGSRRGVNGARPSHRRNSSVGSYCNTIVYALANLPLHSLLVGLVCFFALWASPVLLSQPQF